MRRDVYKRQDYDRIITGDLGAVGKRILLDLLEEKGIDIGAQHMLSLIHIYIHQILMHKWHIAVSVGMALVIFFGFRYDVLGYNTFLPAQDEVASMAVRSLFTAWSYPCLLYTSYRGTHRKSEGI